MVKKILYLILVGSIFTLTACGQKTKATKPTNQNTAKTVETKLFGVNLINNGGAESGNVAPWTNADDNLKTFRYDGGWGDAWQVTPPNHGDSFFYAKVSKDSPVAVFTQKADVSKIAQIVDENKVSYNLSGWFGSRVYAGGRLILTFYDAGGKEIKTSAQDADATEKITSANRPDDVTMVEKTRAGQIPSGTRSIKITLEISLVEVKSENDGDMAFADNLSLILTSKEGTK